MREAFRFWLKLGFISFGGPAGQIAIMHTELVERRRWISERRFLHALNYCMVLPGPEAQQLATYIGWLMHRTWGGIVAGALFVLPSLFILIALSWIYMRFGNVPAGRRAALRHQAGGDRDRAVRGVSHRLARAEECGAVGASRPRRSSRIFAFDVPFPRHRAGRRRHRHIGGRSARRRSFRRWRAHGMRQQALRRRVDRRRHTDAGACAVRAVTLALRVLVGLVRCGCCRWRCSRRHGRLEHTLTQMGWFFTKAALLTFGGAYAVLPYVYQGAVEDYAWLTPTQMIDGLALGETTPGPLIMVVAFVGFVGAYGAGAVRA